MPHWFPADISERYEDSDSDCETVLCGYSHFSECCSLSSDTFLPLNSKKM